MIRNPERKIKMAQRRTKLTGRDYIGAFGNSLVTLSNFYIQYKMHEDDLIERQRQYDLDLRRTESAEKVDTARITASGAAEAKARQDLRLSELSEEAVYKVQTSQADLLSAIGAYQKNPSDPKTRSNLRQKQRAYDIIKGNNQAILPDYMDVRVKAMDMVFQIMPVEFFTDPNARRALTDTFDEYYDDPVQYLTALINHPDANKIEGVGKLRQGKENLLKFQDTLTKLEEKKAKYLDQIYSEWGFSDGSGLVQKWTKDPESIPEDIRIGIEKKGGFNILDEKDPATRRQKANKIFDELNKTVAIPRAVERVNEAYSNTLRFATEMGNLFGQTGTFGDVGYQSFRPKEIPDSSLGETQFGATKPEASEYDPAQMLRQRAGEVGDTIRDVGSGTREILEEQAADPYMNPYYRGR